VALQFPVECPEVLDPALDFGELGRDQLLEAGTEMLATPGVRVARDLPDTHQRQADLLGPADEPEALEVSL
jgi:hypothetical protein